MSPVPHTSIHAPAAAIAASQPVDPPEKPQVDQELFSLLRQLRNQATEIEKVPVYMVFSNASLEEMATYYPHTKEELVQMKGVGDFKVRKYGEQFMGVIHDHCKRRRLSSKVHLKPQPVKVEKPVANQKSTVTTVLYYKQGLSIREIAELRKVTPRTVVGHLVQAYENGADLKIEAFVPAEKQREISTLFHKFGTTQLTTVMEKLSGYSYDDLRWVRAKLMREGAVAARV